MPRLLEIDSIAAAYGRIQALRGLSLAVDDGEIVALLGANGAGKSTTLRVLSGLLAPAAGQVLLDGQPITGRKPEAIVRLGVAHVPEGRHVFPGLSVRENILLGGSNRGRVPRAELEADADRQLEMFPELRPFERTLCWKLSGGQLQMVAIARGLMARPRLLLLDEPSLGLAPLLVQQLYRTIADIGRRGVAVLVVEQNARVALSVARRGYVLENGHLAAEGTPESLWRDDAIHVAYLGGSHAPAAPAPSAALTEPSQP